MAMRDSPTKNVVAERLWYVVKEAIERGVSPQEFKQETAECWKEALREMSEEAAEVLRK